MGAGLRDAKRQIKSVQSTKKITRAMELIAASRFQKAQQRMAASRPYAEAITAAVRELASNGGSSSKFLAERENRTSAGIIVVTSDRGLAGPFSSSVLKQVEELIARLRRDSVTPKLFVTGRKGTAYFRFRQRQMEENWVGFSENPKYDDAKVVADAAMPQFLDEKLDEIYVVYTRFVSSLTQQATIRRVLPLEVHETDRAPEPQGPQAQYEYEPDASTVLEALLPRYIEVRTYTAFLESAASEQAARRRAMSTATENATNLIGDYTRKYNRARQAEITQELMEVVGAAEASKES